MIETEISKNNSQLLVLAGGFGTRLKSVVADVPKPMAPVDNTPFLKYLLISWLNQGIRCFTFLLYHQAELIEQFILSDEMQGLLSQCDVDFIREPQAMGTGGAIAYAVQRKQLNGSFLVANADTWLGEGLAQLVKVDAPCLGAVHVANTSRYGALKSSHGKVEAFVEKQVSSGAGWINAGVYHLHSGLFEDWDGEPFSLEDITFPKLVAAAQLGYVALETDFIDIGIPEDYFRFCKWIESNRQGGL